MSDDLIGQTLLERFTVQARIGEGGMGVVYRVVDEQGQPFAIKRLHAGVARNPNLVARFEREASAHGVLVHPNIATLHAVGADDDGRLCFLLELVDGQDVGDILEDGPLPRSMAVHIAREVLSGLHHAHQFGMVHRDLKPENVLMAGWPQTPQVKLIDFGLVKMLHDVLGAEACQRLTTTGMVFGSPQYMSPEQINGDPVDPRTDLYAVGVMLFAMLTAQRPFDHEEVTHLWRAHLHDPVPSLTAQFGEHLDAIVRTLMAKRPDERFESASAASRALASVA